MAQRAQLASKLCLFLILIGCAETSQKFVWLESNSPGLHNRNGIVYLNELPFTGGLFTLYENKDTAQIQQFLNGKEHGTWKRFYPGKKLAEERSFTSGRKAGILTGYYENGQPKLQYIFKNDEYDGLCREWNTAGVLIKAMHYKNGHEAGTQQLFYDNGKVRANYVVIDGRRFGLLGTKNCMNVSDSIFKN